MMGLIGSLILTKVMLAIFPLSLQRKKVSVTNLAATLGLSVWMFLDVLCFSDVC